jgi:DNA-binding NtrC family response regulator
MIAATHQNLQVLVQNRVFRADLFYRISAIQLVTPALSERVEDIPLLAENLLGRLTAEWSRPPMAFARPALALLQRHTWPGNIRELRNVLERALLAARSTVIEAGDLDFAAFPRGEEGAGLTHLTLRELEKHQVALVLGEEGGHVERAAKRLGIPRSTLYQKIKVFGL